MPSKGKAALIIEHLQNDVIPPSGVMKLSRNYHIVPRINQLLNYQGLTFRVASQSSWPADHELIVDNHKHKGGKEGDHHEHRNPHRGGKKVHEIVEQRFWPKAGIRGTWGNVLVQEVGQARLDIVFEKRMHPNVVTWSCFSDVHGNGSHELPDGTMSHDLEHELKQRSISDVFVVGHSGTQAVPNTARDAAKLGFKTFVVEDAIGHLPVWLRDEDNKEWKQIEEELVGQGVKVVKMDGPEVEALRLEA